MQSACYDPGKRTKNKQKKSSYNIGPHWLKSFEHWKAVNYRYDNWDMYIINDIQRKPMYSFYLNKAFSPVNYCVCGTESFEGRIESVMGYHRNST